jgi:hypothetical protein
VASSWPSEVPFASLLVYSPNGQSEVSRRSKSVCYSLKQGDAAHVDRATELLKGLVERGELPGFFGPDVGLVPAPRSAPPVEGGLWPAELFARRFAAAGLGKDVYRYLVRREAVPKSAYAAPGERPSVQRHYETIDVHGELIAPTRLLVVDDVITCGRTLLACVRRLQEALPACEVRCFALVRTKGLQPEVERTLEPCIGRIFWRGTDADREP